MDKTLSLSLVFRLLPGFAAFLKERAEEFMAMQLQIAREMHIPMLQSTLQLSDQQIIDYARPGIISFLEYLSENRYREYMLMANETWRKDELGYTGKYGVAAEDITQVAFLRNKAMKKFVPAYTREIEEAFALAGEIDDLTLATLTLSTKTLLDLLKDRIDNESHFATQLINATPGFVFIYNSRERKITYLNQNFKELLGFSKEQMEGVRADVLFRFIHPEDLPGFLHHFEEIGQAGENKTFQHEYRFRHADGSFRWVRNYEVVFRRNEDDSPLEILGESFDITREKEVALTLSRRDEQLIEAQNIAAMGSFEWNIRDNKLSSFSEQIYRIFEFKGSMEFADFISNVHPDDKQKVRNALDLGLETGNYECEYRYLAADREKYLWTKGVVGFDDEGPVKMIGTVQDITERRKMEETLLQKTIELQKINADLSEFTYVASHDLKEPLRKISVYADMIFATEYERLSQLGQSQLKKIVDSSMRMRNLIDDILTLSSVSASRSREWVSLQTIFDEVCSLLDLTIRQKEAEVRSDGLPEAYVIPVLFNQLFLNLIGNSLKFSKKDVPPVIEVNHVFLNKHKIVTGNEANAFFLQIRFTDNGIGFENEFSEKIFHLFGRLHTVTDYEGTGLGLSICKRIIEEHGGTIHAQGHPGQGAAFTIIIPYQKKQPAEAGNE